MQSFIGKVISNKMNQTVNVTVGYSYPHRKYKKLVKRTSRILAHNTLSDIEIGDLVRIEACRPISRNKHFVVKEILERGNNETMIVSDSTNIGKPLNEKVESRNKKEIRIKSITKSQNLKVKTTTKNLKVKI